MEHERISEPADAVIASESDQPDNGQDAAPAVEVATPQPKQPKQFSSELSAILTTLGAAVGTGNIWRFPRILARNTTEGGGLLFIIRKLFYQLLPKNGWTERTKSAKRGFAPEYFYF
jgi:hypothetical protein